MRVDEPSAGMDFPFSAPLCLCLSPFGDGGRSMVLASSRRKRPTIDGPVLRHGESLFLFLHEVEGHFVADSCFQDLEDWVISILLMHQG